jgi:sugar lactone lactonase YvrE
MSESTNDRWQMYSAATPEVASGWSLETVTPPSRLAGSNGMTIGSNGRGSDGRLYVTQVFGSQVTAINIDTGTHEVFSPLGGGIVAPDDGIFGPDGTFFATEPFTGSVTARNPDGTYRVVRADLPGANGITLDHAGERLFVDEFRPGGRLMELDPTGAGEPRFLMEDLNGPNAPSMGPDGRIYFPQVFANEIWVYDLDAGRGQLLFDDLSVPTAVKFDSRGRIVVSESGTGHITAIDVQTGARETLAEVPTGVDNVSVGPGDRIFVSHYVSGRVAEETGNIHRILSEPGLLGPHGLALGPDGSLLLADGLSVATIPGVASGSGTVERLLTLLLELHTLAIGVSPLGDDLAVLAITGEILVYRRGSTVPVVLVSGLDAPTAILADGPGTILVVERGAGRILRVNAGGQVDTVASGMRGPNAVARDEVGSLFVSQSAIVEVLQKDGSRRGAIEGFSDAQGIAASGGTLLVADVSTHELIAVDIDSGNREVVVTGAPIGQPVAGLVPAAFCSICPDGAGGFYVGANGDGSVRRLRRR